MRDRTPGLWRGAVSPWAQVALGSSSIVLGVLLVLGGAAPAGIPFMLLGILSLTLAALRRPGYRRKPRGKGPGAEPPVSGSYLVVSGLGLLASAAYLFYRGDQYLASGNAVGVLVFCAGLLAVVLASVVFGGIVAWHRLSKGKGGRLARRLYPVLAQRVERESKGSSL